MTNQLISPEIVDTLTETIGDVLGDAPRIFLQGRHDHPALFATVTTDALMDYLSRVLARCVGHLDAAPVAPGAAVFPRDAALAHAILRSLARWPTARARAAEAWQLAINLHLLETELPRYEDV